jgi:hypothetical protein
MWCGKRRLANNGLPTARLFIDRVSTKNFTTLLPRHLSLDLSLSASDTPNGNPYREVGHDSFDEVTQLS